MERCVGFVFWIISDSDRCWKRSYHLDIFYEVCKTNNYESSGRKREGGFLSELLFVTVKMTHFRSFSRKHLLP